MSRCAAGTLAKRSMADLAAPLELAPVRLEPLDDHHVEPLRAVCAEDQEIWDIYPANFGGEQFDTALGMMRTMSDWTNFAAIDCATGEVVGMSHFIRPTIYGVVEIGGTYISPRVRGGTFNRTMKALMIERAFEQGFVKIEFRVDTRNTRSMRAVEKLGALREGTIRQDIVTWTGYRRDTALYGLLMSEWTG